MICAKDVTVMDNINIIPMELDDHVTTKQKNATTFILENGKKLLQCAREGDSEGVVRLLTKGAPITTDWLGTSPLHLAVMNNHYETCQVLLSAGVSKDGRTKVDRTPLHFAAYEGYHRIAKLLLKHGADVDCRDMLQMTPLHWAVEREHKECVKVLLNSGAKINSMSRFSKTPLSIAMDMNWHEVVHLLQKASSLDGRQSIKNLRDDDQFKGSVHKITIDYDHDTLKLNNDKLSDSSNLGEIECDGIDSEKDVQNVLASLLPQVEESPNEATLQLLKEHGITMLPADNTNTVNSAMQCGRKIVLSDAGKLVLKDVSLQKDPPKPIEIKKRPIILPPSTKMKNAKIYTMTSSQLLAMTNKPNILQKLPDAVKKGTGINFVQLPKNVNISPVKITPYAKNIKIMNTVPMKTVPNSTLVKNPNTSTTDSSPPVTTIRGEVIKLSQLKNSKIIKLKNGTNLMNSVKLVIKNGLGKVSDVPEAVNKLICDNTSDSEKDASTNEITSPLNNFAPLNDCIDLSNGTVSELEKLKSELTKAKGDLEYYKRKYQEAQAEIMIYKKGLSCHSLLEMETNSID